MDNLLDTDPKVVGAIPGVTNNHGTTLPDYDVLGSRFYVGIRARF